MEIDLSGIVIVVGNYGSGKSEVCINLAVAGNRDGPDVRIADLDIVNPYFRTREARKVLDGLGIDVVLPPEQYLNADLPVVSPKIAGMLRRPGRLTLLDVGGNDVGARVLAALAGAFGKTPVHMLQVVNPFRPCTDTIEGCLKIRSQIESASKMAVNGLIGNANLLEETRAEDIYTGYAFVKTLSERSGLPLICITAGEELVPALDAGRFSCPVLPIARQLVPPWKRAAVLRK